MRRSLEVLLEVDVLDLQRFCNLNFNLLGRLCRAALHIERSSMDPYIQLLFSAWAHILAQHRHLLLLLGAQINSLAWRFPLLGSLSCRWPLHVIQNAFYVLPSSLTVNVLLRLLLYTRFVLRPLGDAHVLLTSWCWGWLLLIDLNIVLLLYLLCQSQILLTVVVDRLCMVGVVEILTGFGLQN